MIDMTLVTIHGFWSSPATWDRLNASWDADEQLRGLQIHQFGYPSPKKPRLPFSPTRVPDYDDIAQTLATEYTIALARASNIAIVTHSQGGLILQRFLTWMLGEGRGRELARIRTAVMLACPNGGSEYLRSVRHVLGYGRHAQAGNLEALNRRVADAQRTVLQRIVNATDLDDNQCPIPLHVYAGNSDRIVTAASAQAGFPRASVLAGNHFSILDPASPGNRTAETVKHHLIADSSRRSTQPIQQVPPAEISKKIISLNDGLRTGILLAIEVRAHAQLTDAEVILTSITGPPDMPKMATPARLYWHPGRRVSRTIANGAFALINVVRVGPLPPGASIDSPDYDLPWSLRDGQWRVELQFTATGYSAQIISATFNIRSVRGPFSQTAEWMELSLLTP